MMSKKNTLTLGSLFDGSGGFPLGGILSRITPLWASEVEPFAIRVTTKRLPQMKHYGDITALNGAKLPPVDIITFGSPCQNMSIAGNRSGLKGEQSCLFYEAVRIVKEMRCATDGKYPRFIVWENVEGAFSSNGGEDFRCVLEEICKVKDSGLSVPMPDGRWAKAGEILGDGFSVAWRLLDAQYWGVPQRRKRIYLVADFADGCAGKILFESEGVSGYSAEGFRSWQRAASGAEAGIGASGIGIDEYNGAVSDKEATLGQNCGISTGRNGVIVLNGQGGDRMDVTEDVTCTLRTEACHPPCVMEVAGCCTEHSAKSRTIGYGEEMSLTLRAGAVPAAVALENHPADCRLKVSDNGIIQTITERCGTGGGNVPMVMECMPVAYGIDRAAFNQGANAQYGFSVDEERQPTITARGPGAVATYNTSKSSYHTDAEEELANTLVATDYKDPPCVNDMADMEYIVRRLTPTECARLQGFPDWWCAELETENPSDEELAFWRTVFDTHARINGVKPRSDAQIKKWLANPHSDSAEYRLWGNGICLSNAVFALSGIVYYSQTEGG